VKSKSTVYLNLLNFNFFSLKCCLDNNWGSCRKFYEIYKPNSVYERLENTLTIGINKNVQITTFNKLKYKFDGYGTFILAKAKDNSFEIQGRTKILWNDYPSYVKYENTFLNISSLSGSLFDGLAMRADSSPVVQIEIDESIPHLSEFCLFLSLFS
jgi:hypothetical protein